MLDICQVCFPVVATSLDLNNFITSEVVDFSNMFNFCQNLQNLYINHFDTTKATNL